VKGVYSLITVIVVDVLFVGVLRYSGDEAIREEKLAERRLCRSRGK